MMTNLPKFQIVIPHRHQSSVREIHTEADLLTQDERDDMHSAYEFFSVQEMLDWAEAYCGHQRVRVLAEVRDLAAELEAQA